MHGECRHRRSHRRAWPPACSRRGGSGHQRLWRGTSAWAQVPGRELWCRHICHHSNSSTRLYCVAGMTAYFSVQPFQARIPKAPGLTSCRQLCLTSVRLPVALPQSRKCVKVGWRCIRRCTGPCRVSWGCGQGQRCRGTTTGAGARQTLHASRFAGLPAGFCIEAKEKTRRDARLIRHAKLRRKVGAEEPACCPGVRGCKFCWLAAARPRCRVDHGVHA